MINMKEDRDVLARFDTIWARVQPEHTQTKPEATEPDDEKPLRLMIEQTGAAAKVLATLSQREPCHAAQLRRLSCERGVMTRQMQGAYYLLTGSRASAGASCTVRHESAACLRCLWQTSRNQALHARRLAEATDEPLLKTLYTELADLLEEQCEPLQNIVCALIG